MRRADARDAVEELEAPSGNSHLTLGGETFRRPNTSLSIISADVLAAPFGKKGRPWQHVQLAGCAALD